MKTILKLPYNHRCSKKRPLGSIIRFKVGVIVQPYGIIYEFGPNIVWLSVQESNGGWSKTNLHLRHLISPLYFV